MTSTIPPMRGAGEVPQLPRDRTPSGTSQHKLPQLPPPVRVTTAPPRSTTIPPLPKAASASGTPAPQLLQRPTQATLPPPVRSSRPSAPPPLPFPAPVRTAPPMVAPVAAPFEPQPQPVEVKRSPTLDHTGDVVEADDWFEPSRLVDRVEDEAWLGTQQTPKLSAQTPLWKKLILPAAAFIVLGMMIGGFVAYNNRKTNHVTAPPRVAVAAPATPKPQADVAAPLAPAPEPANAATATAGATQPEPPPPPIVTAAPAPAPVAAPAAPAPVQVAVAEPAVVHEVQTTRGIVKLVDVRIDSAPSGATVMLVDNGKTSFLGTTPVSASVDPARAYDVIFTLSGHATQMAHFDPNKTRRVDLLFAKGSSQIAQAKAAPAPAPSHHSSHATAHVKSIGSLAEPSFDRPAETPAPAHKAEPGGDGTLMVSSKPPCEIYVDGKPTGLTTPQRSIALSAGAHKITFVNSAESVNKTVAVSVRAGQPTKLIQNFMQ
jgi:hypothetical protein